MSETNGNGKWPLPEGWVWTTISSIGANEKHAIVDGPFGSNLKLTDYIDDTSGVPVLTTKNLAGSYQKEDVRFISHAKFQELKRSKVEPGDILMAKIGSCGRTGIYPQSMPTAIIPANLLKVTVHPSVNRDYVFYYFNSPAFHKDLEGIIKATAQPAFSVSQFRTLGFPLAPRPVQDQIVSLIETHLTRLDAAVAALKRAKANLARYKAAVLKAAVEGRLVAQDPGDEPAAALLARILAERRAQWAAANPKKPYVEPKRPEVAGLPGLPGGWVWATVEQVGDVTGGLTKNQKRNNLPMELPYLRVANVYANRLELDNIELIGISPSEVERVRLKRGDLLVVEGNGSVDQIGRVSVWDGSIDPCVHQNHIIKVRFIPKELSNFCLFWLLSSGGRNQITLVASSTSGLYTLSLSKVASLLMPLPPLSEQKKIVEEAERQLSIIQSAEQTINANLARAERLRQGVLGKAFRGELV